MSNQDFLVLLIDRNFLKFSRLLAADALSGPQTHNVAGLAEISDAIDLAMVDGKDVVHAEIPVRLVLAFQPDLVISKALVLKRLENISVTSGQGNLLLSRSHNGPGPLDKKELPLQSFLGILRVGRTGRTGGKPKRHSAHEQERKAGMAQSRRHRFPPIS